MLDKTMIDKNFEAFFSLNRCNENDENVHSSYIRRRFFMQNSSSSSRHVSAAILVCRVVVFKMKIFSFDLILWAIYLILRYLLKYYYYNILQRANHNFM
jgi:hypothetical protein